MPTEYSSVVAEDHSQQRHEPIQGKACAVCLSPLLDPATTSIMPATEASVCASCRPPVAPSHTQRNTDSRHLRIDVDCTEPDNAVVDGRVHLQRGSYHTPIPAGASPALPIQHKPKRASPPQKSASLPSAAYATPSSISTTLLPINSQTSATSHVTSPTTAVRPSQSFHSNPLTDITRLRVRHQTHHCLYPGSTFKGTQKSGKNSYDVNVTIVDVDFKTSWLCGYLKIQGLTEDWPELTTYFDAEIVGSRHGFLTQKWGAAEHNDKQHWSRFPAFRHVKNECQSPSLTIPDRERGAVFMRWKEKFLVPNHRVQDINGASFAGFYYVCVDFNPPSAVTPVSETDSMKFSTPTSPDKRQRRSSSVHSAPLSTPRHHVPPVATMNGFYFHQNSEPFQQLSLNHVPERAVSSFEFR